MPSEDTPTPTTTEPPGGESTSKKARFTKKDVEKWLEGYEFDTLKENWDALTKAQKQQVADHAKANNMFLMYVRPYLGVELRALGVE